YCGFEWVEPIIDGGLVARVLRSIWTCSFCWAISARRALPGALAVRCRKRLAPHAFLARILQKWWTDDPRQVCLGRPGPTLRPEIDLLREAAWQAWDRAHDSSHGQPIDAAASRNHRSALCDRARRLP